MNVLCWGYESFFGGKSLTARLISLFVITHDNYTVSGYDTSGRIVWIHESNVAWFTASYHLAYTQSHYPRTFLSRRQYLVNEILSFVTNFDACTTYCMPPTSSVQPLQIKRRRWIVTWTVSRIWQSSRWVGVIRLPWPGHRRLAIDVCDSVKRFSMLHTRLIKRR